LEQYIYVNVVHRMIELMAPQPYCSKLSSPKLGSCFFSELQSDRVLMTRAVI